MIQDMCLLPRSLTLYCICCHTGDIHKFWELESEYIFGGAILLLTTDSKHSKSVNNKIVC